MYERPEGARDGWLLAGLIVLAIVLDRMQVAAARAGRIDPASLVVRRAVGVLGGPANALFEGAGDFGRRLREGDRVARENDALRMRLGALSMYAEQIEGLKNEVGNLRTLSGLAPLPGHERVTADVVDFHQHEGTIDLSVGTERGVAPDQPVICAVGLVAIVKTAWKGGSQAALVTNVGVQVGGLDLSRKPPAEGMMRGRDPSTLVLEFFDPNAPAQPGDTVVTSGHSAHIPRSILVGRIVSIQNDADYGQRRALVFPFMNPSALKEVQILR